MVTLEEAEGVVAPHVAALVWVDGREVYARNADRVFDLASLTKPLCTAEVALRGPVDRGHPLLPPGVTLRHLLQHAGGFPAWRPYHQHAASRDEVYRLALAEPLVARPGEAYCYSDVGFLALGAVLEAEGGRLDRQWSGLAWGAEVNDENARAMGGIAPHAGLFGSARQVVEVAARWLGHRFGPAGPGTHRDGWDTPGPGSTAGPSPPADAVGHLGYTGTSIWMSPSARRITVLLTDRVVYTTDPLPIRRLRQAWHEWAWTA